MAAKRGAVVLKEEGVPVAVGTELGVELVLEPGCILVWHGHMSLNDASTDKVTVEPAHRECNTNVLPYPSYMSGSVTEAEIMSNGKVTIRGALNYSYELERGPGPYCHVAFEQTRGELTIPGFTKTTARAHYILVREERPFGGFKKCRKTGHVFLHAIVLGHNGKSLETELVG